MTQPDSIVRQNALLTAARRQAPSPACQGASMSRRELADAVNAALHRVHPRRPDTLDVDARWIGRLERGDIRWPSAGHRAALRHVLGADTDAALGLHRPRSRRTDATPQRPHEP